MNYLQAQQYLNSFIDYEKLDSYEYNASLRLDRMRNLAALLGDPQKDIPSIHVAGTKGKGSTAAIIYSVLKASGFRVGLYTSPHLVWFRERIRINDEYIGEDDICRILETMRIAVDKLDAGDMPSFFEVYTALAYCYFKEKKVDFAVYEVGMGGRLDATNIIEPLVSVITPISYEHTQKLGNTLILIAGEKAGIIKTGVPCVSAPQDNEALGVIEQACRDRGSKLVLVGRDILFKEVNASQTGEVFTVTTARAVYDSLKMGLIGSHQVMNAAAAIGAAEELVLRGVKIPEEAVRRGIEEARWPGRLEVIAREPFVILDGAQNRASAAALADSIRRIFKFRRLILVLGVSKDKDIRGIVEELVPQADSIIATKAKMVERALDPAKIRSAIEEFNSGAKVAVTSGVEEAFQAAVSQARPDDLILITGSLFVVGEVKGFNGHI